MRRRLRQVLRPTWRSLGVRLQPQGAFGLVELLIAMVMTSIAVMALVAALSSGNASVARASRVATATTVANAELETYRAMRYSAIPSSGTTTQTKTGADGRSYTLVTTFGLECPDAPNPATVPTTCATGRLIKRLTVVVSDSSGTLVRQTTTFDELMSS